MLPVAQAELLILEQITPLVEREILPLNQVNGRILAESVISPQDFPYWHNSAMDGYAVQFDDVGKALLENPVTLQVIEEIPAGKNPQLRLQSGQAARIFTGAKLPLGADTIVMQENTQIQGNQVQVLTAPKSLGDFVRYQSDYCQKGDRLLTPGIKLQAAEIAVLATTQVKKVPVYRRPRVAIFSTGDELITVDQSLESAQIVDSNQYALAAFVESQGAVPLCLGIVKDDRQALKEMIKNAIATGDFVLSTGGVSVGDYDYVEALLTELGGEIMINSVAIKPGKPLTIAKFANGCLYFGIPGNPVSALVSCWRFVQPALSKLSGLTNGKMTWVKAKTQSLLKSDGKRETYLWGSARINSSGEFEFQLASGSQSSANLINLVNTNALAVLPVGITSIESQQIVKLLLIC
ncbi:MAG: molybdopterin molybdotransferase MoeA [Microcystaceae cyanobacterium]